jgi:hypothetical protein
MYRKTKLSEQDIESIRKLARDKRFLLGFSDDPPIANDLYTILDKLEIILLEIPIEAESEKPAFSAVILYSEEGRECLVFIGLNTADYYDKQIFAIAHELSQGKLGCCRVSSPGRSAEALCFRRIQIVFTAKHPHESPAPIHREASLHMVAALSFAGETVVGDCSNNQNAVPRTLWN